MNLSHFVLIDIHFYSRTSCEVQQGIMADPEHQLFISTHAPLARCNLTLSLLYLPVLWHFYSRTSCEVQLNIYKLNRIMSQISTHAPLARCNLMTL